MIRTIVIIPPDPVVTLEEAKQHLRVDGDDDDALITAFVAAATGHLDGPTGWLGRSIGVQTLEFGLDGFCHTRWPLPYPPIVSVTSIVYEDATGVDQTLDAARYEVRDGWVGSAWGEEWPATRAYRGAGPSRSVRVRYQAGYAVLPPAIKVAILLMVGDMYRNRDGAPDVSPLAAALLQPFRVYT